MEDLQKLVQIVTNRGQKSYPLLENKIHSKETELFNKIKQGKVATDKEAASNMYGSHKPEALKMLKSRLRRKLLNHLFFLDFTDSRLKISHRYEQECLSLLFQSQTLQNEGEHKISLKLLQKTLKLAAEAEFTSIIVNCLESLIINYALTARSSLYYKSQRKLVKYLKLFELEHEAQDLYFTAKLELNKSVFAKRKFLPKLKSTVSRLEELWKSTHSANIFEYFHILNITRHELDGNYSEILQITTSAEKLLAKNKLNKKRFDIRYNKFITVYAYLREKDYQKGLAYAETSLNAFDRSTNNWFAFMENYFLLAIHAGKYDLASKLYENVSNNLYFKKISASAQERWMLYGSYLYVVSPSTELLKKSLYRKIITSAPDYSKDKQGFNVAILILQFIYYVQQGNTEVLSNLMESLKKYAGRHLRDNFSQRSVYFLKLLEIIVKSDLDYLQARQKGKIYYDKLKVTPVPGDAYAEIEIIPYEELWGILMDILNKQV